MSCPCDMAMIHLDLGDHAEAFAGLNQGSQNGSGSAV
jgi:hypothetical protein